MTTTINNKGKNLHNSVDLVIPKDNNDPQQENADDFNQDIYTSNKNIVTDGNLVIDKQELLHWIGGITGVGTTTIAATSSSTLSVLTLISGVLLTVLSILASIKIRELALNKLIKENLNWFKYNNHVYQVQNEELKKNFTLLQKEHKFAKAQNKFLEKNISNLRQEHDKLKHTIIDLQTQHNALSQLMVLIEENIKNADKVVDIVHLLGFTNVVTLADTNKDNNLQISELEQCSLYAKNTFNFDVLEYMEKNHLKQIKPIDLIILILSKI